MPTIENSAALVVPLVVIANEAVALRFSGVLVSNQMDVVDLAVLREHADDIALRQLGIQAADEDPARVLVHLMPGA